jgi:hypothetical protein
MTKDKKVLLAGVAVVGVYLSGCNQTQTVPTPVQTAPTITYTIVHSVIADGEEFISVVVRPGVLDSELTAAATELHHAHPHSHINFYDEMNVAKIKQWWACFLAVLHDHADDKQCHDNYNDWSSEHHIATVSSSYDNAKRTGQPKWFLVGKMSRRIAYLGLDN